MADGENGNGKEEGVQFCGASPAGAEREKKDLVSSKPLEAPSPKFPIYLTGRKARGKALVARLKRKLTQKLLIDQVVPMERRVP